MTHKKKASSPKPVRKPKALSWADKIVSEYPDLIPQVSMLSYGVDCQRGWETLIRKALIFIRRRNESLSSKLTIIRIKEKYGGLRIYVGKPATDENKTDYLVEQDKLEQTIHSTNGYLTAIEDMSYTICELCGASKAKQYTLKGLVVTRCEAHKNKSRL